VTDIDFDKIASELEALGHVTEARELTKITARKVVPASVIESIRLLETTQAAACQDPKLVKMAARASLLSHQIQGYYGK
jgi:hypothetical protein